jgi:hypothetical protein
MLVSLDLLCDLDRASRRTVLVLFLPSLNEVVDVRSVEPVDCVPFVSVELGRLVEGSERWRRRRRKSANQST